MKEINLGNVEEFVNAILGIGTTDSLKGTDGTYRKTKKKVVKTITTTTSELIEDDELVKDLVDFCDNRYVFCCRHINEFRVRDLLKNKYHVLNINKYADKDDDYIYVMDYPDIYNYRYPGDYCPDAQPTCRSYSFSNVLDEFIDLHPDKCRWETKVETKVIEED